jgi:hypothetical protein
LLEDVLMEVIKEINGLINGNIKELPGGGF